MDTEEADAQRNPNAEKTIPTNAEAQCWPETQVCAHGHPAAWLEDIGLCHASLKSPNPELQRQWVPSSPHQAFAIICEQRAEVQVVGVAQEGVLDVYEREVTGPR